MGFFNPSEPEAEIATLRQRVSELESQVANQLVCMPKDKHESRQRAYDLLLEYAKAEESSWKGYDSWDLDKFRAQRRAALKATKEGE